MLSIDDIRDLGAVLSEAGFKSSIHHQLAAHKLISKLKGYLNGPDARLRLITLLAPIFCTKPEEQQQFGEIYIKWLKRRFGTLLVSDTLQSPPLPFIHRWVYLAACMLLISAAALYFWQDYRPREFTGRLLIGESPASNMIVSAENSKVSSDSQGRFAIQLNAHNMPLTLTVSGNQISASRTIGFELQTSRSYLYLDSAGFRTQFPVGDIQLSRRASLPEEPTAIDESNLLKNARAPELPTPWDRFVPAYAVLASITAILIIGWWLFRSQLKSPVLQRLGTRDPAVLQNIHIRSGPNTVLPLLGLRQLTRSLRGQVARDDGILDVVKTVDATASAGGLFTPVYTSRFEPSYIVLVDRSTVDDHQARLASQLLAEFCYGQVLLDVFEFSKNPSLLRYWEFIEHGRKSGRSSPPIVTTLSAAQSTYGDRRLLIFADVDILFDGFTGQMYPWVEKFSAWQERYIVTGKECSAWTKAEWLAEKSGFRLIPISRYGFMMLSDIFQGARHTSAWSYSTLSFKPFFDQRSSRWLDRDPPLPAQVSRLCHDLERTLGPSCFLWLCSCAAYPELIWGLTLRLGIGLLGRGEELINSLPRLARLVWFREAFMPDWLRATLLQRVSFQDRQRIDSLLSNILADVDRPGASFELKISLVPKQIPTGQSFWQTLAEVYQRIVKTRSIIAETRPKSPLRDAVFLQFLSNNNVDNLTPWVPKPLLRVLLPHSHKWLWTFRPRFHIRGIIRFLAIVWSIALAFMLLEATRFQALDWAFRSGSLSADLGMPRPSADAAARCAALAKTSADAERAALDDEGWRQARFIAWKMGYGFGYAVGLGDAGAIEEAQRGESLKALGPMSQALRVPAPSAPPFARLATAIPDYGQLVEDDQSCTAAFLSRRYDPRLGHLYQAGAVIGFASVYRVLCPQCGALFVSQIRHHASEAGLTNAVWQPFTQPPPEDLAAEERSKKAIGLVERIEEVLK
jgi:hypothetical protein